MAATMAVPTNWSDPWDLTYPRASSIRGPDPFQFLVELFDLFLNELPLIPKHVNRTPHLRCQIGLSVLQNACNRNLEICWLLGKDHPAASVAFIRDLVRLTLLRTVARLPQGFAFPANVRDNQEPFRAVGYATPAGTRSSTSVPASTSLHTVSFAPMIAARSRMPAKP